MCAFNAAAPLEQRSCAFPQEWADDDALRRWRVAHAHEEAEARALGAAIDGEEDAACIDSQKAGGKKKTSSASSRVHVSAAPRAPRRAPIAAGETEEQARRRRAEAGIKEDLPRGEVSGFAAEAMCAEDEEAHDDPNRKEGAPHDAPPVTPRRAGGGGSRALRRRRGRVSDAPRGVPVHVRLCSGELRVSKRDRGRARDDHHGVRAPLRDGEEQELAHERGGGVLDKPVGLKIGQWLDEVGVDVARGKGGGPGADASKESSKRRRRTNTKRSHRAFARRTPRGNPRRRGRWRISRCGS